jgi:hypothetical protein
LLLDLGPYCPHFATFEKPRASKVTTQPLKSTLKPVKDKPSFHKTHDFQRKGQTVARKTPKMTPKLKKNLNEPPRLPK